MRLSVIIPVYNAAAFLGECLDSVFSQTGVDLEVIAVDDASTDGSAAILAEYAAEEPRLRVLTNHTNRHAGVCRNLGLAAARGTWLHFLDADDRVMPGAYARFVAFAEENDLDIVRGNGESGDGAYRQRNVSRRVSRAPVSLATAGPELLKLSVVPWLGLVRRDFVQAHHLGFGDLVCANDVAFFLLSLSAAERIQLLREPLVWHRVHRRDSLVGRRPANFTCDFENYRTVLRETAKLPRKERIHLLSGALNIVCSWLKRYPTCAPGRWPAIRAYAADFFRTLDLAPWEGRARRERWYYDAFHLLPAGTFARRPAFPIAIVLGRLGSLWNRLA